MPRWMSGWMDYTFAPVWARLLLCQKRENYLSRRIEGFTTRICTSLHDFIHNWGSSHVLQTSRSEDYRWPKALIFLLVARWNEKGRRTIEREEEKLIVSAPFIKNFHCHSHFLIYLNTNFFCIMISDSMGTNRWFARSMNNITEHFIWYIFQGLIISMV